MKKKPEDLHFQELLLENGNESKVIQGYTMTSTSHASSRKKIKINKKQQRIANDTAINLYM